MGPAASDPDFEKRVRTSFDAQAYMGLIGARLERVEPGLVDVALDFRQDLTQQDGFLHAAVIAGIADSACGYAAYTLMPADSRVLSVEFKMNLLRPAKGERFLAEARVLRAGRTITVVRADVRRLRARGEDRRDDARDDDPTVSLEILGSSNSLQFAPCSPRFTVSDKIYYVK